ncbi:MAG TPA: hypothetical protein PLO51_05435, partial [Candidatus Micrarchaeota archaeon]|nr:hypothetical protein [Candidatus Micrarchaeota archaeon]
EFKKSGKTLEMNTHVTNASQLLAPENRETARKLLLAGVSGFWLQAPLQEGVNFWRNDLERSVAELGRMAEAAKEVPGVHLYKLIVDMNSPNNKDITVPIEAVAKTISGMYEHQKYGDMNMWQAVDILTPLGNAYINAPGFSSGWDKEVDRENGKVTYYWSVESEGRTSVIPYDEPLVEGINDSTATSIAQAGVRGEKIGKVRDAWIGYKSASPEKKEEAFGRLLGESNALVPENGQIKCKPGELQENYRMAVKCALNGIMGKSADRQANKTAEKQGDRKTQNGIKA